MKKGLTEAEYIAELEAKISSISEEMEALSKERDHLQEVILKMSDELRNLRRMMFGRRSERFIAEDPAQLSLSFDGVDMQSRQRRHRRLHPINQIRNQRQTIIESAVSLPSIWSVGMRLLIPI